ncbi:MAG: alpha/beta hydrolase fold domain-containing protein [Victivallaceae bacterium]|nr:alpha/beta hydrolase fold domain-containing protein [Victivallaceae bacterium]
MLKQIILTAVIIFGSQFLANAAQVDKMRERMVFHIIARQDNDGDGKISRSEFKWRSLVFDKLDVNKDGYLDKPELLAAKRMPKVPKGTEVYSNIVYANIDGKALKLDIYVPQNSTASPLLIWIHGGGWKTGSKEHVNRAFISLTQHGFAVASIDYSLLGLPGMLKIIHECKGAVRFLRANAKKYGIDATKIGVGGGSAGGHLAMLLGTSGGIPELEGTIGGNLEQSSKVQAVVDLFGPSDFTAMSGIIKKRHKHQSSALAKLLSPATHVGWNDPPLLIYHGSDDRTVPVEQGVIIDRKYREAKLESTLHIIDGAGHGFKRNELPIDKLSAEMNTFFTRYLKNKK